MDESRHCFDVSPVRSTACFPTRIGAAETGQTADLVAEELNRFTVGCTAYFALADSRTVLERLDRWLRRRLRQVRWKECKHVRSKLRNLRGAGIPERDARE